MADNTNDNSEESKVLSTDTCIATRRGNKSITVSIGGRVIFHSSSYVASMNSALIWGLNNNKYKNVTTDGDWLSSSSSSSTTTAAAATTTY